MSVKRGLGVGAGVSIFKIFLTSFLKFVHFMSFFFTTPISLSNVFIFRVISFNTFGKFLKLGNSAWDFLGAYFWSRDFFGFCWKPWGFFRGF